MKTLQSSAWALRKQWCREWRQEELSEHIGKGCVIQRSKRLHRVTGVILSTVSGDLSGQTSSDHSLWEKEVFAQFTGKWGANDSEKNRHSQYVVIL